MSTASAGATFRSWRIAENQNACCDEQLRRALRAFESGHRREVARIAAESRRARSDGGGAAAPAFPYLEKRNALAVRTAARADGPGSRTLQLARSALIRLRLMEQRRLQPLSPPQTQPPLHLMSESRAAELLAGADTRRRRRLEAARQSGRDLDGRVHAFLRRPAAAAAVADAEATDGGGGGAGGGGRHGDRDDAGR